MRREHRLSPLQMRVARQNDVALALRGVEQALLQLAQAYINCVNGGGGPEVQGGGDLIVAAAAGVQLAADVAEPLDQRLLDVRVNIFQLRGKGKLATLDLAGDVVERLDDALGLVG